MKFLNRISKWFYYFAIVPLTMGFLGWQSWLFWSWLLAPPLTANQANQTNQAKLQILIPPGTPAQQIGNDLNAAGVIRSAFAWKLWSFWLDLVDRDGGFQAGTYELSPTQSLPEVAQQVWQGEVMQLSFTIPEGWTIAQMANYFDSLGYFKAEDFIRASKKVSNAKYPWLPQNLPHLEGFLYPDTYKLPSDGVTPERVIQIMLDRFAQVALPIYEQGKNQTKLNLLEWTTLGSIVEKEAVVAQERERIAGVFTERLRRGMKLETDPTVEYGLGIQQTADQPLTYAQVKMPSPYNTYLNPGLPPTPIAAPGKESLQAALYPEKTEYLFFVARYDGTHVFSKTLAEHEAAKNLIRQRRNAQQKSL